MSKAKKGVQPFKVNKKGRHVSAMESFIRLFALPLMHLLFPYKIYGRKKAPEGRLVFVGNHYRIFDIVYCGSLTWEGIHYVAKSELTKNKLLSWLLKKCESIVVHRDGSDIRAVMDALIMLKKGDKLCIFPEGTRNKTDEEILPFFSGASLFAIKARAPVMPIAIYEKPKWFRRAHILVGEPFELKEFYDKKIDEEMLSAADEKIKDALLSLKREHKKQFEGKRRK